MKAGVGFVELSVCGTTSGDMARRTFQFDVDDNGFERNV